MKARLLFSWAFKVNEFPGPFLAQNLRSKCWSEPSETLADLDLSAEMPDSRRMDTQARWVEQTGAGTLRVSFTWLQMQSVYCLYHIAMLYGKLEWSWWI